MRKGLVLLLGKALLKATDFFAIKFPSPLLLPTVLNKRLVLDFPELNCAVC